MTTEKVLILGAGASRAQWIWEDDQEGGHAGPVPPPLNFDFFDIAKKIDPDFAQSLYEEIRLSWLGKRSLKGMQSGLTMEDAFHFVFENAVENVEDTNSRLLYAGFLQLIGDVIACTTNLLCKEATGPIAELLLALLQAQGEISIVSFNYDLLVERSLTALGALVLGETEYLQFPDLYRVSFLNAQNLNYPLPEGYELPIHLLKPHGSLNWMIDSRYSSPSVLIELQFADLRLFQGLQIPLDENNRIDHIAYSSNILRPAVPFIIPPTRAKDRFRLNWLRSQDAAVNEAIQTATEIIIFGYSFPEADPLSRWILRTLSKDAAIRRRVAVVDPSKRVAQLLQNYVGGTKVIHSKSVHELINRLR